MKPSVTATFRFYAELNDFVERSRRGREFAARCAQAATAKHMIEALGVPHTEVALLLVNGEPAQLDHLLAEGDRVAAYPFFSTLPAARFPGLPAPSMFVADAHLGGLARVLRMAGFDTLYDNGYDDATVARLGIEEERTILTRDRELLKRRGIIDGCFVHALAPPDQFREVALRYGLAPLSRPFTRCLHCNAELLPVALEDVTDQLPPSVRATQREFRTCPLCRRVYWKGTHWQRMSALLAGALPATG